MYLAQVKIVDRLNIPSLFMRCDAQQVKQSMYLWFEFNISEQMCFSLVGFFPEVAQQIQSV
jgi:hypothetical protein